MSLKTKENFLFISSSFPPLLPPLLTSFSGRKYFLIESSLTVSLLEVSVCKLLDVISR